MLEFVCCIYISLFTLFLDSLINVHAQDQMAIKEEAQKLKVSEKKQRHFKVSFSLIIISAAAPLTKSTNSDDSCC